MKELYTRLTALVLLVIICFVVDMKLRSYSSERRLEDGSILMTCVGKIVGIDVSKATGDSHSWS
ncbi:MAG: hypothetical protein ACPL7B_16360, partial [Candidatus Poribacteria bacterium]